MRKSKVIKLKSNKVRKIQNILELNIYSIIITIKNEILKAKTSKCLTAINF